MQDGREEILRARDARTNEMAERLHTLVEKFLADLLALRESYLAEATAGVQKLAAMRPEDAGVHEAQVDAVRLYFDARFCEAIANDVDGSVRTVEERMEAMFGALLDDTIKGFGPGVVNEALETAGSGGFLHCLGWIQRGGDA